jgi:hypothetical protein
VNQAQLRIGDAEREAAARELGEHYAQGRITAEEHTERLDLVWSARTAADLAPAFSDLPGPAPAAARTTAARESRPWHTRVVGALMPVPFLLKVLLVLVVLAFVFSHWSLLVVAVLFYVFGVRRLWLRGHRGHRHPRWR